MISFICPACSQAYNVPDDKAGKKTTCKQCASPLTIPGDTPPGLPPAAPQTETRTHQATATSPAHRPEPDIEVERSTVARAEPACPKCAGGAFAFQEVFGPVALMDERNRAIDDAAQATELLLDGYREQAQQKMVAVERWSRAERDRLAGLVSDELSAIDKWERDGQMKAEQDHKATLKGIQVRYAQAKARPADPDDPASMLLDSPEVERRKDILGARQQWEERRGGVAGEAEDRRAEARAQADRETAQFRVAYREKEAGVRAWLDERESDARRQFIEASRKVRANYPLQSNNRLYLVYCSSCGHVVTATGSPGNLEERLVDLCNAVSNLHATARGYIKAMVESADAKRRAQMLKAGLDGLNHMLND